MRQPQRHMIAPARVPAMVAAISALSALSAAFASQNGTFSPTALVKMAANDPIAALARRADPHFHFVTDAEHYDGVYYYAIARDPFARGSAHTLIDQMPYRYGHPLHGWLAGLLSLGRASAVPNALLLISVAGLALAGWAASRLASTFDVSPWWGLAVAASPGLLYAVTVSTSETVGVGLIFATLLAAREQHWRVAYVLAALCCFDKEQYVLLPIGLAVFHVSGWLRGRHDLALTRVLALGIGPALLAAWFVYMRATVHQWPVKHEAGNIAVPPTGWHRTLKYAHAMSTSGSFSDSQLGSLTAPILVAIAVLLLAAAVVAVRLETELDAPFLGIAAYTFALDWRTLLYPHELLRMPAVALVLAVLIVARPARPDSTDSRSGAQEGEGVGQLRGRGVQLGGPRAGAQHLA